MTTILTKKYAKFGPKSQSTTKHRMFRAIYVSPENFTPTLLVMLETFRRSAGLFFKQLRHRLIR